MEKLNEVKQALKYLEIDAKAHADNFSASMIVSTKNILAIAEAFRALEQRAEAAEAKLAELAQQKPIGWLNDAYLGRGVIDGEVGEDDFGPGYIPIYRHPFNDVPTPTTDLAELVPDELTPKQASRSYGGEVVGYRDGWNACRAEMLRNIAQADRDKFFKFLKDTSAIVDSWPDWKKQGSDVVKFLSQSPPAGVVEEPCPKGSVHEWVHHAPCYNPDYEECNKCGQRKECSESE